jgi:hypothetical protein
MQYLRLLGFPIPGSATWLHSKVLVNGSNHSANLSGVLLVSAVIISAEFCSLENGLLSSVQTQKRWGSGRLIRWGSGRLMCRSTSLMGKPIRCSLPHSPTYVVHEVSREAENPALSTLLRASLRKAALSYDDELNYVARPKLSLFSNLAGTHRQATDRQIVTQSADQLLRRAE